MLPRFFVLIGFFVITAPLVQARIGESRNTIEGRLLNSGGLPYKDEATIAARSKGKPYKKFEAVLPPSAEVRIYYKTADGTRPKPSELEGRRVGSGWDVHVLYVNGRSVLEIYERSQEISEFELNQLLAVQAGGAFWKKLEASEEKAASAFDYGMIRSDGEVRAIKVGEKGLLFVDAAFDTRLAEVKEADLLEKAPVSVQGF